MPDPILPGRIGLYVSMLVYGLRNHRGFAVEHSAFFRRLLDDVGDVRGRRVLDLGCGKTFWLTLLMASHGAEALGVDTEVTEPSRSFRKYLSVLRENGFERAARTLVWDALFASPYYAQLERAAGVPLRFDRVRLQRTDGSLLPCDSESVDLVVSHEVLEHVQDVAGTAREIRRVLKPGGVAYLYVHHFTSLSGGHHIAWKHPDTAPSRRVPPWDHLRRNRYPLVPSWLNQMRAREYREIFERDLAIVEWRWLPEEGERLLTPAIRAELSDFDEVELLHKGFIIVARRNDSEAERETGSG